MLTVWGRATSVNVQKVMWLIGELDLSHERIDAGGRHGRLDSPEFRALSPHKRVPVIVDDGTVVWESNACLRYLASRFEVETLWPANARERSQIDRWLEWSQNHWHQAVQSLFWIYVRTPRDQRNEGRIREATEGMAALTRQVDGWLAERPYISGDSLSLADFVFGTTLFRFHTLEFERVEAPSIRAYYERLSDRTAYARHVKVDYAELRAPGAEAPA